MTDEIITLYQNNHINIVQGEEIQIQLEYNRIKNGYTDKYGCENIHENDCCFRINTSRILERKRWKYLTVCGKLQKLNPCKLGFINHYQCLIDQQVDQNDVLTISHICGKHSCINGKHMRIETQSNNVKRCICHNKLIQFERKYRKNKQINTKGKLLIEHIMNAKNLNEGDEEYYQCTHDPVCFMIFGKL